MPPFRRAFARPVPVAKGLVRRSNSPIHILGSRLGHSAPNLAGRRIEAIEGLTVASLDPLAGDEHAISFYLRHSDRFRNLMNRLATIQVFPNYKRIDIC